MKLPRAIPRALFRLTLALTACGGRVPPPAHAPPVEARATAPAPASAPPTVGDGETALLRWAGIDPAAIRCNHENRWGASLKGDARDGAGELMKLVLPLLAPQPEDALAVLQQKLQKAAFWRLVRAVLIEGNNNNLGVLPLKGRTFLDPSGRERPVVIFRSGFTPAPAAPGSCFASLLDAGGVRHVVNLFDGDIPAEDLVAAESRAAADRGASYRTATDDPSGYGPWRALLREGPSDVEKRRQASLSVARLIREQILLPGGAPPRGNLHVHCGGGMHRTGMVVGVVERCVNGAPLDAVEAHYREHVGYRDDAHPGGLEEDNLRFIREFDCGLVR